MLFLPFFRQHPQQTVQKRRRIRMDHLPKLCRTLLIIDQRIPVWEALKAVTINAAYQYFEEAQKGSITPGKRADFVILSENPLEVPKDRIRKIRVLETIKDGESIFRREY